MGGGGYRIFWCDIAIINHIVLEKKMDMVITLKSVVSRLCNKGASCGSMLCSLTEGRSAHFQ